MTRKSRVLAAATGAGAFSAAVHSGILPWSVGYSDVLHLFPVALAPGVPYIERPVEYPVLTGLVMRLLGWLGRDATGYYILTAAALAAAAALCAVLLSELAPPGRALARWSLAPTLLWLLVFNWDAFAVLCALGAAAAHKRRLPALVGVLLGLGFCFKLYPALYMLPALVAWRREPRRCLALLAGFAGTALLVNGPFAFINWSGWSYCFEFNFAPQRFPNPDSIWSVLRYFSGWPQGLEAGRASSLLLLAGLSFSMWRLRDASFTRLCFAATLVLLLSSKFFSPQYALWLLPFFALEDAPAVPSYGFELANLGALFAVLQYILVSQSKEAYELCALFVVARHACLAFLLGAALKPRR